MKARKFLSPTVGFLLILLGACSLQAPPTPVARSFSTVDLLIDVSVFPPGWAESTEGPSIPAQAPLGGYKSIERIELFFYVYNGVAYEQIHRFRSGEEATSGFDHLLETRFTQREIDTPWVTPPELPYQSPIADRSFFACAKQGGVPGCKFLGQYQEYVVFFGTHMSPNFMTYPDLEQVLQAIDKQMELVEQ